MAKKTVKTAELKAHLSAYLRRAKSGQRVIVLDRSVAVAELGPPPAAQTDGLGALAAAGRARLAAAPLRRSPFAGTPLHVDVATLLAEVRGER